MKWWAIGTVTALACAGAAQMTSTERKGLSDALVVGNLREADLRYERRTAVDPFAMALPDRALATPIEAAEDLMRLHEEALGIEGLLGRACDLLGDVSLPNTAPNRVGLNLPPNVKDAAEGIASELADANRTIQRALSALTPEERQQLLDSLPAYALGNTAFRPDYAKGPPLTPAQTEALLRKVDLRAIRQAAQRLTRRMVAAIPTLRAASGTPFATRTIEADGLRIVIGGQGDDVHAAADVDLVIDLGGRDTYIGRYAGGIGKAAAVIDLAGADDFEGPDASMGAGVAGIGILFDIDGNASYRTRNLTCGAAAGGVGVLWKEGGNDTYASGAGGQGAAAFGVGLLLDTRGDDRFQAERFAQGAARPQGVGWLSDRTGNDAYRAESASQGFALGGVGMLSEHSGDDVYVADVRAQAAGMAGGLGSLADLQGRDSYAATEMAQSYAEGGVAMLFELGGDDIYAIRQGLGHAFAQNLGVAFLLDRTGDDLYAARDGSPGSAWDGGLAIFLEAEGQDRYAGVPARAIARRGSSSIAVFADLTGDDRYPFGFDNDEAWARPEWGTAIDQSGPSRLSDAPSDLPRPGSLPKPDDAVLRDLFSRAATGAAADRRLAFGQLVGVGLPAFEAGLATANEGVLVRLADLIGAPARAALAPKILGPDEDLALKALRIAAESSAVEAGAAVAQALGRPNLRLQAAIAAGPTQAAAGSTALLAMCASPNAREVRAALGALRQLKDENALATAIPLLDHPDVLVQRAAIGLLGDLGEKAEGSASLLIDLAEERKTRQAAEILGRIGTPSALARVAALLDQPSRGIRISALLALDGQVPDASRPKVEALRSDLDPLVRMTAARIDLGR